MALFFYSAITDPCSTHGTIKEWERSIRNNKVSSTLCDSFLKEGWYKITSKAGEVMPTTCPHYGFRCGTVEPIWLNGEKTIVSLMNMLNDFSMIVRFSVSFY